LGRKVHPLGFRLGIIKEWQSRWYADRTYTEQLHEDIRLRALIHKRLPNASLSRVDIERSAANQIEVTLFTAKPGIVIGKGGQAVELMRKDLEDFTGKKVKLNIHEIKQPEIDAYLVAESIADQITRRVSYKRAMKQAVQRAMRLGAKGIKIRCGGRLGGAEMARIAWEKDGRVPLHTIRADIDYGQVHAHTTYGRVGVKVWIYRGDVIGHLTPGMEATVTPVPGGGRDGGRRDDRGRGPGAGAPRNDARPQQQGGAPAPRPAAPQQARPAPLAEAPAPSVTSGFNNNVSGSLPDLAPVPGAFGDAGQVESSNPAEGGEAKALEIELERSGEDLTPAATASTADTTDAGADMPIGSQAEGGRDDADAQAEAGPELSQAGAADANEGLTDEAAGASGTEGAPNMADSGSTDGEEG
jgi:small subunit ribosomal protein S3